MQPHPSFDVDGDGVISNLDYYLAKQFDRDNNGVLDDQEIVEMRTVLTKKGTQAFNALGHGPHVASIAEKTHSSLLRPTPRQVDPTKLVDPTSDQWHLQMKHLELVGSQGTHYQRVHLINQPLLIFEDCRQCLVNCPTTHGPAALDLVNRSLL